MSTRVIRPCPSTSLYICREIGNQAAPVKSRKGLIASPSRRFTATSSRASCSGDNSRGLWPTIQLPGVPPLVRQCAEFDQVSQRREQMSDSIGDQQEDAEASQINGVFAEHVPELRKIKHCDKEKYRPRYDYPDLFVNGKFVHHLTVVAVDEPLPLPVI